MFDQQPQERELVSWLGVIAWAAIIYLTIPFVRLGTNYVKQTWGSAAFTYAIALILLFAAIGVLAWLLRRGSMSPGRFAWVFGVAGAYIYLTFGLKAGTPEEAVHFLEYGILSVLIYRAFSHRIADPSIYLAATLAGTLVGMIDEAIQWLVPERYFDLRDIWLNLTAVALVQIGIAGGVHPAIISGWPAMASLARLCRLGAIATGLLGLFHLNTPHTIAAYSARTPTLGFLSGPGHVMIEYGHLYDDPEIGRFRSRLGPEELKRTDRSRAHEVADILDRHPSRESYGDFLRTYTAARDPFLHEVRVHLYSRNVNAEWAQEPEKSDQAWLRYTVTHRENRILEKYFGETLRASASIWSAEFALTVEAHVVPGHDYESLVSRHLITTYSPLQAAWLFFGAMTGLLVLGRYLERQARGRLAR